MKKLFTAVLGAATMLLVANAAFAAVFPPGSGTCPDTMSIFTLKTNLNLLNPCSAVTPNTTGSPGDTVLGVGGTIIGFDENPTGFDVYIQESAGGYYTGIDVFTHGTNMRPVYGFNRGDSIIVEYARVANFFGDVELESPNNNFSSPNIRLRIVSTGNALPPFFHGNTSDFKELPANPLMPQIMSSLVTLDGPVRVARTLGLAFRGMLVVRDASPGDSVFIDFNKLTVINPPAVGTVLTSVSGIINSASRGWRIMPRDGDDIVDAVPPGVADAYAVADAVPGPQFSNAYRVAATDAKYRVVFDRKVTQASAESTANYTLASFGTVNSATMDSPTSVILGVSGTGLSHGQSETITTNGIRGLQNFIAMTTGVQNSFLAGVLSCCEMSAANPDSLAGVPCQDRSRYCGPLGQFINGQFGPRSTFTGTVVGIYGNLYYMEDDPATNPCGTMPTWPHPSPRGITVFAPPIALTLGHSYVIAGADEEFYSENEFAAIVYVKDTGNPGVPAPYDLLVATANYDTCDGNQNLTSGRDYLSSLVRLQNVKVVQRFPTLPTNGFHVAGSIARQDTTYSWPPDTIFCENLNNALGANVATNYPAVGLIVDVVGVMHYTTNTSTPSFRVCPRNPADITTKDPASVGLKTPEALTFSAYPNPARSVKLAFSLPRASHVQLGVYDLVGRRVALLSDGSMPAGSHVKVWSGQDDNGNRVHPGMYFYRLRVGNDVRRARTVLIAD